MHRHAAKTRYPRINDFTDLSITCPFHAVTASRGIVGSQQLLGGSPVKGSFAGGGDSGEQPPRVVPIKEAREGALLIRPIRPLRFVFFLIMETASPATIPLHTMPNLFSFSHRSNGLQEEQRKRKTGSQTEGPEGSGEE